jgi:hypothetical protein
MRRHKLIVLEKAGLVQEGAVGYNMSFTSNGVDDIPESGDAVEDEKLRTYMIRKAREDAIARMRRMKRIRKLARMDFKMIGGVSPIGFYGGAGGGGGGGSRQTSMAGRG